MDILSVDVAVSPVKYAPMAEFWNGDNNCLDIPFSNDEKSDAERRLRHLQETIESRFAQTEQQHHTIQREFERLRVQLQIQSRGIWFDFLIGVLAKLAVVLGVELVEMLASGISGWQLPRLR